MTMDLSVFDAIDAYLAPTSKTCTQCGETKLLREFTRKPRNRDGRDAWCYECHRVHAAEYYRRPGVRDARMEHNRAREAADPIGYRAYRRVHNKLQAVRGPANAHACNNPACSAPAYSWALDPASPNQQVGTRFRWSENLDDYRPMCHSCNLREDAAYHRGEI